MHVQTENETPDAWLGLVREPKQGRNPLGPTLKAIMVEHFGRVFFGPEGNFWRDTELKQQVRRGDFRSARTPSPVHFNLCIRKPLKLCLKVYP